MRYEYREIGGRHDSAVGGTRRVKTHPTSHASFIRVSTSGLQPMADPETMLRLPTDPPAGAFRVSHSGLIHSAGFQKGASLCVPSSFNHSLACTLTNCRQHHPKMRFAHTIPEATLSRDGKSLAGHDT